jgi:acetyl esterase/lipase
MKMDKANGSFLLWVLLLLSLKSYSQEIAFSREEAIYKQIDTVKLKMGIYKPAEIKSGEKHPTIVFFFGGGWMRGTITQFEPFARHFASGGMVSVLVDYRV